ncbi:MAG: cation:proton antiporter [Acidobacteria bacterium]|nr:cation:proton antiporter [Acidobacteriota bacterium]
MPVAAFVALLGGLLVLAYFAEVLFARTRIPAVVILIFSGVLIGPLLSLFPGGDFTRVAPYFGAVALIVILFEGGLELDLDESARGLLQAALLAGASFFVVGGTLALFAHGLLDLPWSSAIALGSVLGVPSSAVVLPIASTLGLRTEVRTVVVLEAAIADVLGILGAGIAIEAGGGASVPLLVLRRTFLGFTVGALVALVVGLVWSRLLRGLRSKASQHGEVLTFGVVLVLDGVVHAVGGASAIGVVAFGLVLANEPVIMARLLRRPLSPEDEVLFGELRTGVHRFTSQLTFLIRTFFFVFLGVVIRWTGITWFSAFVAALFVLVVILGRRAVVVLLDRTRVIDMKNREAAALSALYPRGLVTAVLAFGAVEAGLPGSDSFPLYAFAVLIATNLLMVLDLRRLEPPDASRSTGAG